ncbi:MAG: winged helix-turn-helix domain-containing protein [Pseudomonadales bacterium]
MGKNIDLGKMNVFLISNDKAISDHIFKNLQNGGFLVNHMTNNANLCHAQYHLYDAIVIDRELPKTNALDIIRSVRASQIQVPILLFSTLGDVVERVNGLKSGADDYLVKPFAMEELVARVGALIRRVETNNRSTQLSVGDLEIDLLTHRVIRAGHVLELSPRQYRLLAYLVKHADQVVTRKMVLENVWDCHFDPDTSVVEVQIARLRRKIDYKFKSRLLHTKVGRGYMMSIHP